MPFNQHDCFKLHCIPQLLWVLGCEAAPGQEVDTSSTQCLAEMISCDQSLVLDLSLSGHTYVGAAPSTEAGVGGFITSVEAGAGGVAEELDSPWRYLSLGPSTWDSVSISDLEAMSDPGWDLAVRRDLIRLNSGTSGPGCTTGLPWIGRSWDEAETLPEGLLFFEENFYNDDCVFALDSDGLPGAPRLVLDGWWEDRGCIAMTGLVWLIAPRIGGVLKASVERYYAIGQKECDSGLGAGQGGGSYRFRWQWLVEPG